MTSAPGWRARLRADALALGVMAAVVGSPRPPGWTPAASAAALAEGRGRLSVIQVAQWIRDRKDGLTLLDVRSREAFDAFHVPTSRWIGMDQALGGGADTLSGTVVLVGDGGPVSAQAWTLLQGRTPASLFYMDGGVDAWLTILMSPVLPEDATPEERVAWVDVAEVSRYFGGIPLRGGPRDDDTPPPWFTPERPHGADAVNALLESARRRGCGF